MLLHDYLKLKAAILTKAKADIDNLLTEIADPKMKEAVDDWDLGDPITDNYPQVDQEKKEAVADQKNSIPEETKAPLEPVIPPVVAQPTTPGPDAADSTNHTV